LKVAPVTGTGITVSASWL